MKPIYMHSLFLTLVMALSVCKRQLKPAAVVLDRSPFIALQTHGCRGWCPTYKLTCFRDKTLEYEGIRNMEIEGKKTMQLTDAEFAGLEEAVKTANLWKYPDRIESTIADAPMSTLTTWKDGLEKSVTGTIDRPKPVQELERTLQELAENHGIPVKKGVGPDQKNRGNTRELLINFNPDVNAGNWITKFADYDLRLIKRTGEANVWIVSYDPKRIGETELLDLVRNHPDVMAAQPNRKTQERD